MNNNRDNNFKTILLEKLLAISKNKMSIVNLEKNQLIKDCQLKFFVRYLKKKIYEKVYKQEKNTTNLTLIDGNF